MIKMTAYDLSALIESMKETEDSANSARESTQYRTIINELDQLINSVNSLNRTCKSDQAGSDASPYDIEEDDIKF
jgi:hypothetical protein